MHWLKLTKLRVLVLVVTTVLLFWWFAGNDHPADPGVESTVDPSLEKSVPETESQPGSSDRVTDQGDFNDSARETPVLVDFEGQMISRQEQGIGGMQLELSTKASVGVPAQVYTAFTDPTGSFQFESVPLDNNYRLEALASGGYAGTLVDPFPINRNMSPVTIMLESVELASVDGMFVDADYAPVADFEILVQNIGLAYPARKITSDSSGFFQLQQFPAGSLQFSASGNENFHVSGVELKPGDYRNLEIVVDKGNYHLSGSVTNEFGTPISEVRVVLTSDFTHADYRSTSYRLDVTDIDGGFSFANLAGLQHRILVDAIGYENKSIDHRFEVYTDSVSIQLQKR